MSLCHFHRQKIRHCVWGTQFTVATDHSSLHLLHQLKELKGRFARWALCLQAYTFTKIHLSTAQHQNTNASLRMLIPALKSAKSNFSTSSWDILMTESQKLKQSKDPWRSSAQTLAFRKPNWWIWLILCPCRTFVLANGSPSSFKPNLSLDIGVFSNPNN